MYSSKMQEQVYLFLFIFCLEVYNSFLIWNEMLLTSVYQPVSETH